MKKKKVTRGHIQPYKTYLFRTKDPVIDELRTMRSDGDFKNSAISESSGVATTTLYNWWHGKTKRPQSATVEAVGRAMGRKRVWTALTADDLKGKK